MNEKDINIKIMELNIELAYASSKILAYQVLKENDYFLKKMENEIKYLKKLKKELINLKK